MKKLLLIFLAFISAGFTFAQKLEKVAPKIIIVGLGEKNPYFDELLFPHLYFYYTPALKIDYGQAKTVSLDTVAVLNLDYKPKNLVYSGEPKYIEVFSRKDDPLQLFLLFDKNGYCYTYGYKLDKDDMGARKCENGEFLLDNLVKVVKKGKAVKKSKKSFVLEKTKSLVGNKLDNFPIQNQKGDKFELQSVMGKKGSLVVFFNLPSTIDIRPLSKENRKLMSKKEIQLANERQAIAERSTDILRELEKQFFNLKVK